MKKYSLSLGSENRLQYFLAVLLLVVYAGTLFFPLMDKDAARHANVALKMQETGEWWKLVERNIQYLDKPHFLFWMTLISYKVFGVTVFAVRLMHLLCALAAVYSIYRLAKHLSDKTTAKLAAIILATAQAFVLAIMDARMETPLTVGIAFGLWQLIVYVDTKKFSHIFLAALGAAVAFSTKGWVGPVIIFVSTFFYLLLNRKWSILARPLTWAFLPLFFVFITPVLYAYYQQFDLHPEIVVRGTSGHSGVKFILWEQNFERMEGDRFAQGEGGRNKDYFFLYHTFLWAFFPWCIPAVGALVFWFRRMVLKKKWRHSFGFAPLAFLLLLFLISFSKFKMPHYIIMLLPLATLMTAPYLRLALTYRKSLQCYFTINTVLAWLILPVIILLNYYFFSSASTFVLVAGPLLLLLYLFSLVKKWKSKAQKTIYLAVALSLVFNFYLYYNFFPNLMQYQGGNVMATEMKKQNIVIADRDIRLMETSAHMFDFARKYNHPIVSYDSLVTHYDQFRNNYFLLSDEWINRLTSDGYLLQPVVSVPDYNVSTVDIRFLNPKTRGAELDTLMLAKIIKP